MILLKRISTNNILEIRAENGILAHKFIKENYKYSILNIFKEKNKIDGIDYIKHCSYEKIW